MAFKIAGSKGFKKAVLAANPVLLEPIYNIEVEIPDQYLGSVNGSINSRRGRIMGMDVNGKNQVIRAKAPMSELLNFAPELQSMTGGEGAYSMEFSHYEEVPAHQAQKIIDAAKGTLGVEEEED